MFYFEHYLNAYKDDCSPEILEEVRRELSRAWESIQGDPLLEVCLDIAMKAHRYEERFNHAPYIIHVLNVYNILNQMGASPVQRAVGLLHDVVESNREEYGVLKPHRKNAQEQYGYVLPNKTRRYADYVENLARHTSLENPDPLPDEQEVALTERLSEMLANKLLEFRAKPEDQLTDAERDEQEDLAGDMRRVAQGVVQLTNGLVRYENKRSWQVDHIRDHVHNEFKPVKIVDQIASVIDDIRFSLMDLPSNEELPTDPVERKQVANERIKAAAERMKTCKNFALKAMDVSYACRVPSSEEYYKLMRLAYRDFREVYQAIVRKRNFTEARHLQEKFDFDSLLKDLKNYSEPERVPEEVVHVWDEKALGEYGIAKVTLSAKTGKVVSFGTIVDPKQDDSHLGNDIADSLREVVEDKWGIHIITGGREERVRPEGIVAIRDFRIEPAPPEKVPEKVADKPKRPTTPYRKQRRDRLMAEPEDLVGGHIQENGRQAIQNAGPSCPVDAIAALEPPSMFADLTNQPQFGEHLPDTPAENPGQMSFDDFRSAINVVARRFNEKGITTRSFMSKVKEKSQLLVADARSVA